MIGIRVALLWLGLLLLPLLAHATLTPAQAREAAANAVDRLIELNNAASDHYFHSGEWDKAVLAIDRTLELDPTLVQMYATAAWLLRSSGKGQQALACLQRMVARNPESADAYFELGMYQVSTKNDADAVVAFARAVELGLPSPSRHMYGHALKRLGRVDEARAFWQKVLTEEPTNEVAQRELTKIDEELKAKAAP